MRALSLVILSILPLACDAPPAECPAMCAVAAEGLEPCIEAQGLDWAAYGYQDAEDYQDACETWAWEQGQMARAAPADQGGGAPGYRALAARCVSMEQTFASGTCEDQMGVSWSDPAWK